MGPPRDAYVYHYSFNRSRLVNVVCNVIYNPTEVAIQVIKNLASMKPFQHSQQNILNLDIRVSSFLMSIHNATHNIEKEPLYEENSTLLEVRVEC